MHKKANSRRNSWPILGPATAFFKFPPKSPERVLKTLHGDDRLFAEAEIALARCDFCRARELYEALPASSRYSFAFLRIGVVSAVGLGDMKLLDLVLKKAANLCASAKGDRSEQMLADIVDGWVKRWFWLPTGYPDWILRFDFAGLPAVWRHPAAYLGVMARMNMGQFESAYAAAALLMCFDASVGATGPWITAANAYLRMARAVACRETGRTEEMRKWLTDMIRELAPHEFFLPFIIFMHSLRRSPVEEILAEVAPDKIAQYRTLSSTYFANMIRARNHITGEKISEELSCREFYLAMLMKRGFTYKELAKRSGLSIGRIKNLLLVIYQKLGIHTRSELDDLVW